MVKNSEELMGNILAGTREESFKEVVMALDGKIDDLPVKTIIEFTRSLHEEVRDVLFPLQERLFERIKALDAKMSEYVSGSVSDTQMVDTGTLVNSLYTLNNSLKEINEKRRIILLAYDTEVNETILNVLKKYHLK